MPLDAKTIETTWKLANEQAQGKLALKFYSLLFFWYPEVRLMFPPGMENQRDKLVHALGRVISRIDHLDEVEPELKALGRAHRRFGATEEFYGAVGSVFLRALEAFLKEDWTPEVANQWMEAYGVVSGIMLKAAKEQEDAGIPPYWDVPVAKAVWSPQSVTIPIDYGPKSTLKVPVGYSLDPGNRVDVRPVDRPGLWTVAKVSSDGLAFVVRIRPGAMDYAVMALARTPDGGRVRIGPPSTAPEEGDRQ